MTAVTVKLSAPRSQFIQKLHALLESPFDGESLHWVSSDAFEISSNDARARNALSPSWDFRSRLSDRRRSNERRSAAANFIVFSHPSGVFLQGDNSRLADIARKTRNKTDKRGSTMEARRSSVASNASSDEQQQQQQHPPSTNLSFLTQSVHRTSSSTLAPPVHAAAPLTHDSRYHDDRRQSLPSFPSGFTGPSSTSASSSTYGAPTHRSISPYHRSNDVTAWKAYNGPMGWDASQRLSIPNPATNGNGPRRSSISNFKLSASVPSEPIGQPIAFNQNEASPFVDTRPPLRKAASALSIQTVEHPLNQAGLPTRSSPPYPTPTFSPTGQTAYFPNMHSQQQQTQYHPHLLQQVNEAPHHRDVPYLNTQRYAHVPLQHPDHVGAYSSTAPNSLPSPSNSLSPANSPREVEFQLHQQQQQQHTQYHAHQQSYSQHPASAPRSLVAPGTNQNNNPRHLLNPHQVSPQFDPGFQESTNSSAWVDEASASGGQRENWSQPAPIRAAY